MPDTASLSRLALHQNFLRLTFKLSDAERSLQLLVELSRFAAG
jgi:hypothetical protein